MFESDENISSLACFVLLNLFKGVLPMVNYNEEQAVPGAPRNGNTTKTDTSDQGNDEEGAMHSVCSG